MTRPDAKVPSMNINTHGIHAKIMAWVGSVGAGFSFCCSHMEMPNKIGNTPKEINANRLSGAGADKSLIQPTQGAWRNSSVTKITLYNEKKMGICSRIGKQPDAGLTFSFLYRDIISCCSLARSSPERSLIFSISGCNSFIFAIET